MSVTIDRVKCACSDCVCVVDVKQDMQQDGRIFCDKTCADHHKNGTGCQHAGCTCHG